MAWPAATGFPSPALTKRCFGTLAAANATTAVKPAPPWLSRIAFGPAAVPKATETEFVWPVTPPAFIKVEASPTVVAVPITVHFSMPAPEVVAGPNISSTESNKHGLPLPFPSVLANPGRLGPPRFNSAERKTLRIGR
jgi:hypothetical protein